MPRLCGFAITRLKFGVKSDVLASYTPEFGIRMADMRHMAEGSHFRPTGTADPGAVAHRAVRRSVTPYGRRWHLLRCWNGPFFGVLRRSALSRAPQEGCPTRAGLGREFLFLRDATVLAGCSFGGSALHHERPTQHGHASRPPAACADSACAAHNRMLRKLLSGPLFRTDCAGDSVSTTEREVCATTPPMAA